MVDLWHRRHSVGRRLVAVLVQKVGHISPRKLAFARACGIGLEPPHFVHQNGHGPGLSGQPFPVDQLEHGQAKLTGLLPPLGITLSVGARGRVYLWVELPAAMGAPDRLLALVDIGVGLKNQHGATSEVCGPIEGSMERVAGGQVGDHRINGAILEPGDRRHLRSGPGLAGLVGRYKLPIFRRLVL